MVESVGVSSGRMREEDELTGGLGGCCFGGMSTSPLGG